MKFNRNEVSFSGSVMGEGVYKARITDIIVGNSKAGVPMYTVTLENDKAETIRTYMVNNDFFDNTLSRVLGSIYDAGVSVPDVEYTFDNAFKFLKDKPVFIRVGVQTDGEYAGNSQFKAFLSKEQYDKEMAKVTAQADPFGTPVPADQFGMQVPADNSYPF